MILPSGRSRFAAWLLPLLAAGCALPRAAEQRTPPHAPAVAETVLAPEAQNFLYDADEALRDVLSSELQYLGTGRWPGVERSPACAFRNDRVLIVNVYCTLNETPALRLEVYSPQRGRVRIYAEANGPVSLRRRGEYFTFMTESGPPPGSTVAIRPLSLTMSFEELSAYEQRRYDTGLPSCFGGEQLHTQVGGCVGTLELLDGEWAARNRAFIERPGDDWYRVIERMRSFAALYGKPRNEDGIQPAAR